MERKTKEDDRLSSSHHSILSGEIPMKKNSVMITQLLKKCTITAFGNGIRMPFIGQNYPEHKIENCNLGKRSHMQSSHTVLCQQDCIHRVISQNGDRILFERLSTPRPAPKVALKSNWHAQQQQQHQSLCDDVSDSTRKLVTGQSGIKDVRGYTTDDPTSTRKFVRDSESVVDKKPQFEIDLRVEGVSQDTILQDEEKMKEINKKLERLRIGSCAKSIRNDLSNGNRIFSEESSHPICEMGNMELIELRQTSATLQCPSCLKHVPEGLNMCLCGVLLRPYQNKMDRI